MSAEPPVTKLLNMTMIMASRKRAQFIAVSQGAVRFFIDGEWHMELQPPEPVTLMVTRRLGVLIGVLPPKRDEYIAGKVAFEIGDEARLCCLVELDWDDEQQLRALVELVPEAEWKSRRRPRPPSTHPFR